MCSGNSHCTYGMRASCLYIRFTIALPHHRCPRPCPTIPVLVVAMVIPFFSLAAKSVEPNPSPGPLFVAMAQKRAPKLQSLFPGASEMGLCQQSWERRFGAPPTKRRLAPPLVTWGLDFEEQPKPRSSPKSSPKTKPRRSPKRNPRRNLRQSPRLNRKPRRRLMTGNASHLTLSSGGPCHVIPCLRGSTCHSMPPGVHAMPCHAMPCHAMPCHEFHPPDVQVEPEMTLPYALYDDDF